MNEFLLPSDRRVMSSVSLVHLQVFMLGVSYSCLQKQLCFGCLREKNPPGNLHSSNKTPQPLQTFAHIDQMMMKLSTSFSWPSSQFRVILVMLMACCGGMAASLDSTDSISSGESCKSSSLQKRQPCICTASQRSTEVGIAS